MAVNGKYIWPPYQAPSHPDKPPATSAEAIRIRNPAYPDSCNTDSQVARLYHGVELHRLHLSGNSVHFFWVRFVYTVFEQLRSYLDARVPRKLRLRLGDGETEQVCDEEKCQSFARATARQRKSRSTSPKKRPRRQDIDEAVDGDDDDSDEEHSRGRKRRRSSGSSCTPDMSFGSTCDSDQASVTSLGHIPMQGGGGTYEEKSYKSAGLEGNSRGCS